MNPNKILQLIFQRSFQISKATIFVLAVAILSGCATVPLDNPKTYSEVMANTADTTLGRDVARWMQTHDGLSGFYPLSQGLDALGVRLQLDDIFTKTPDRSLLLLDQHANIDVRVFNPISRRGIWGLNFLTSFKQANRRMHNKSFTVDNQASVVGGRTIVGKKTTPPPAGVDIAIVAAAMPRKGINQAA
jgi:putative cardiolipin synthase